MCWPVPGVQIVGSAQRDVSRGKKKKAMGWDRGWKQRNAVPSSLPLPLFLLIFSSLSDRAGRRAALHYLNAWNRLQRCLCLNQGRDLFSRTIVRHQVPVYIPFLLVLWHSTALCSLLTSCFKMASDRATWSNYVQTVHSHLSGTRGVN